MIIDSRVPFGEPVWLKLVCHLASIVKKQLLIRAFKNIAITASKSGMTENFDILDKRKNTH